MVNCYTVHRLIISYQFDHECYLHLQPFSIPGGSKVGDAFRTALTSNQLGWALVESSGDRCDFSRPARMLMRERERVRPKQPKPRKNYDVYNMMVLTTLHHFLFQCLSVALAK